MPKKIRELKAMLSQAGFTQIPKRGKGSHTVWSHPFYNGSIIFYRAKTGKTLKNIKSKRYKKRLER